MGSPVQPPRREEGLSRRHFSPGAGPRSGPGITGRSAVKRLANLVQREALVLTYNDAIMLVGALFLAALFVMPLVRRPNTTPMSPEH